MKRPLLFYGIIFCLTVFAAINLGTNILIPISVALFAAGITFLSKNKYRKILAGFMCIAFAFAATAGFNIVVRDPFLKLSGRHLETEGLITDIYRRNDVTYLTCKVVLPEVKGVKKTAFTVIRSFDNEETKAGEYFKARIKVDLPTQKENQRYNLSNNIYFTAVLDSKMESVSSDRFPIQRFAVKTKLYINENLAKRVDEKVLPISSAIVTGDRDRIDRELNGYLCRSGIIHMVAVSGMHMAIISKIFTYIFQQLKINSRLSGILSIPFLWFYGFICGFPPSTVRSAVMITITLIGGAIFEKSDPLNSLGAAAMLMLTFNPYLIGNTGFQMSYLAVMGIGLLSPSFIKIYDNKFKEIFGFYGKPFCHSLAAWLFVLPVSALTFGYLSVFSPVTNLLVSPFIPIAMVSSLFGGILPHFGIFDIAGKIFGFICNISISVIIFISKIISEIPISIIAFDENWKYIWMVFGVIIFSVALIKFGSKSVRTISVLCIVTVFLLGKSVSLVNNRNMVKIVSSEDITALVYGDKGIILDINRPVYRNNYIETPLSGVEDILIFVIPDEKIFTSSALSQIADYHDIDTVIAPKSGYTENYLKYINYENFEELSDFHYKINESLSLEYHMGGYYKIKINDSLILKKTNECDIMDKDNFYDILIDGTGQVYFSENPKGNIHLITKKYGNILKIYGD